MLHRSRVRRFLFAALLPLHLVTVALIPLSTAELLAQHSGSCDHGAFPGDPFAKAFVIPTPDAAERWDDWRRQLVEWRANALAAVHHSDALYRAPEFAFVPAAFVSTKVLLWDEAFYDWRRGVYKVEEFIQDGVKRFGGYDHVLLWHSYPRLGFDERNQFDFYRDMPGGLAGLRRVVDTFHRHGIKVTINYNPWDTATRREGKSDYEALGNILAATDADGVYLDTWHNGPDELFSLINRIKPGSILETENNQCIENLANHHFEWLEEKFTDSAVPGIIRNKWLERRHMMHVDLRMQTDKVPLIQLAWMNGTGILVWENIFSMWRGWSPQEQQLLKLMVAVQRRYARVFSGEGWVPFVKTERPGTYANLWEGNGVKLWTLVNRNYTAVDGALLKLPQARAGQRYFDLITGRECVAERASAEQQRQLQGLEAGDPLPTPLAIRGTIAARGLAAIVELGADAVDASFREFLFQQASVYGDGRVLLDTQKREPAEVLRPVVATHPYPRSPLPADTVPFEPQTRVIEIEKVKSGFYLFQEPPYTHVARLRAFAVDRQPVTNRQFHAFLQASGYQPRQRENFLKHWAGDRPPPAIEDEPVVYVDLSDARAYAAWAGKRLLSEDEWVHALQSGKAEYGRTRVWEWNESERSNGQTRWCVLHGGSAYKAEGSMHYAVGGELAPNKGAKFILMWPGLDRCSTIGFRCGLDLE